MSERIDINCDLGEIDEAQHDAILLPLITSCNVACGGHAGDAETMERTIRAALALGVAVGAHPSYPDRETFGRHPISLPVRELIRTLKDQVRLAHEVTQRLGGRLGHVKPHGALYHVVAESSDECECLLEAMAAVDPQLKLVGLAGSAVEHLAHRWGVEFVPEAFADRRYTMQGELRSRAEPDAVIEDPALAVGQVLSIVREQRVVLPTGDVPVLAKTLCVHGDHPAAHDILVAINESLLQYGIVKACL